MISEADTESKYHIILVRMLIFPPPSYKMTFIFKEPSFYVLVYGFLILNLKNCHRKNMATFQKLCLGTSGDYWI